MPRFDWGYFVRIVAVWIAIALTETAQGFVRRLWLADQIQSAGQALWILLGLAVAFALTTFSVEWMRLRTLSQALGAGTIWAGLMLAYELFVASLLHLPISDLVAQYDPRQGGLMAPALLLLALTPLLVLRLKRA